MIDQEPEFVVNPSTVLAVIKTGGSLVVFASLFCATMFRLLSARDLAGAYVYLQQNDTVAGLTAVATAGWFVWRNVAAWIRKRRDVKIVQSADNRVAMLSTEVRPNA